MQIDAATGQEVFVPWSEEDGFSALEDTTFWLDPKYHDEFVRLLERTILYLYAKGVVYRTVGAIKDTIYEVNIRIWHDDQPGYDEAYRNSLGIGPGTGRNDIQRLLDIIQDDPDSLDKYLKGLVLLAEYLNGYPDNLSSVKGLDQLLGGKWDVEYILPKKWNNYGGWIHGTWARDISRLGNLVPLDKKSNIKASNNFFSMKQAVYAGSSVVGVKDLCGLPNWTPQELEKRDQEICKRIENFGAVIF